MITFKHMGHWGRLGNQMFQYATLFAIGKKNNYEIGIPYVSKNSNSYANLFLDDCFKNLSAKDCSDYITEYNYFEPYPNILYNPDIFNIQDKTNIHGYFQSEKYFKEYRTDILNEFEFKDSIKEKATELRSYYKDPVICLHIRLGDYKFLSQNHPICSFDYYQQALELLPKDIPIFVFSDEPVNAMFMLSGLNRNINSHPADHFTELCLMSMCDYHIIANSSFSWWGSWLSSSKQTVAPAKWFGEAPNMPQNWNDIYAENWKIL